MPVWQAIILVNLALAVGLGAGWVRWGRPVERLQQELVQVRAGAGTERQWQVRGVVRAVLPDLEVIVVSHEEIPGFMSPMTMGFRTASPTIHASVSAGDAVRFTLRGTPPDVVVVAIEKLEP
jgi:Cu/Ag efflux protein CusF